MKQFAFWDSCKAYLLCNLLTVLGALPFALGFGAALFLRSSFVLLLSCVIGGCCFGPTLSGMVDFLLRRFRHCQDDWWYSYRRAWKQNWKGSLVPGVILCCFLGFWGFMGMQLYWTMGRISVGMALCLLGSLLLVFLLVPTFWVQLVLFQQSAFLSIRNCVIFAVTHFPGCLAAALILIGWWLLLAGSAPWSLLLIPVCGFSFGSFWALKLLYPKLNQVFQIEERIDAQFPEQRML